MYSWMSVRRRQRMWLPSTSASQRNDEAPVAGTVEVEVLALPAPIAVNRDWASALSSTA
jgi:hypothetical protein